MPAKATEGSFVDVTREDDRAASVDAALDTYRTEQRVFFGESTEGAEATGYYEGDLLRLVRIVWLGETGNTTMRFYLDSETQPFLVRTVEEIYDRPFYEEGWSVTERRETRQYFDAGRLALWTADGVRLPEGSEGLLNEERRVLDQLEGAVMRLSRPDSSLPR